MRRIGIAVGALLVGSLCLVARQPPPNPLLVEEGGSIRSPSLPGRGLGGGRTATEATEHFPPAFEEVRATYHPSDARLLDRRGRPLHELRIDMKRLNPNGGSIAIGHPFGMTGSRLVGTIASEMIRKKLRYGVVTMCVGGGQGAAALFERA